MSVFATTLARTIVHRGDPTRDYRPFDQWEFREERDAQAVCDKIETLSGDGIGAMRVGSKVALFAPDGALSYWRGYADAICDCHGGDRFGVNWTKYNWQELRRFYKDAVTPPPTRPGGIHNDGRGVRGHGGPRRWGHT